MRCGCIILGEDNFDELMAIQLGSWVGVDSSRFWEGRHSNLGQVERQLVSIIRCDNACRCRSPNVVLDC